VDIEIVKYIKILCFKSNVFLIQKVGKIFFTPELFSRGRNQYRCRVKNAIVFHLQTRDFLLWSHKDLSYNENYQLLHQRLLKTDVLFFH